MRYCVLYIMLKIKDHQVHCIKLLCVKYSTGVMLSYLTLNFVV